MKTMTSTRKLDHAVNCRRIIMNTLLTAAVYLLPVFLLASCGNDDEGLNNRRSVLTGEVSGTDGSPLEGVAIMAMERVSSEEAKATSAMDGSYNLDLPIGVYDICFDKDGYVTYFQGPIVVEAGAQRLDVQMASEAGMSSTRLTGAITVGKAPAVGWTIRASSFSDDPEDTKSAEAVSDENGFFEMDIAGGQVLDLDFYRPGESESVEFVDIAKFISRPVRVQFDLLSGAYNVARKPELVPSASPPLGGVNNVFTEYRPWNYPWDKSWYLGEGKLGIDGGKLRLAYSSEQDIWVTQCHGYRSLWFDYAIYVEKCSNDPKCLCEAVNLQFWDESRDYYDLMVIRDGEHDVCYNSKAPTVVAVYFDKDIVNDCHW